MIRKKNLFRITPAVRPASTPAAARGSSRPRAGRRPAGRTSTRPPPTRVRRSPPTVPRRAQGTPWRRASSAMRRSSRVVTTARDGVSEKSSTSAAQRRRAGRSARRGPAPRRRSSTRPAATARPPSLRSCAESSTPRSAPSASSACRRLLGLEVELRRPARPRGRGSIFRYSLPPMSSPVAPEQVDEVALGRGTTRRSARDASSSRPDHADDRRRVDGAAVGLVVERDVAAGDGRAERAAGLADALDGAHELAHHLGLLGVAEVQAVGGADGHRARRGHVAAGLGHGEPRALEGIEPAVAAVAVHGHGQRAASCPSRAPPPRPTPGPTSVLVRTVLSYWR